MQFFATKCSFKKRQLFDGQNQKPTKCVIDLDIVPTYFAPVCDINLMRLDRSTPW